MNTIYTQKTLRPENSVGYLINQARLQLYGAVDKELADLDVTAAQFTVMAHLHFGMSDSPTTLCRAMQYDPGAMTRMMDRLEAKNLIRRTRDAGGDRRLVHLELTVEGAKRFPGIQARVIAALNRLLAGFSAEEAREFEDFLKRFIANANA